jgi:hypothetical protein
MPGIPFVANLLLREAKRGTVHLEFGAYPALVPSRSLRTSSPEEFGWAKDHFFYYSEKPTRMLQETGPADGGLVWGKINGEESGSQGKRKYEEFFVGTEWQLGQQTRGPNRRLQCSGAQFQGVRLHGTNAGRTAAGRDAI